MEIYLINTILLIIHHAKVAILQGEEEMKVNLEDYIPKSTKYVQKRKIPDHIILFKQTIGDLWIFNESTEVVWNLIDGKKNIIEISKKMSSMYDVDFKVVLSDLKELFLVLYGCKLIDFINVNDKIKAQIPTQKNDRAITVYGEKHKIILNTLFELLYDCNLNCCHCYIANVVPNPLSTHEVIDILKQLKEQGGCSVTFSGGEIFLRSDIIDLFHATLDEGFILNFISNGTNLKEKHYRELEKVNFESIKFSLYAGRAELHEKITKVPGSFDKTVDAIRRMKEIGKSVTINAMILKYNADHIKELQQLSDELKCQLQLDYKLFPKHDGSLSPYDHGVTDEQLARLFKEGVLPPVTESYCLAGFSKCKIGPDGQVYPCEGLGYGFGTLRETNLQEIWHSEKAKKFRSMLKSYDPPECKSCDYLTKCERCPAVVWEHELYANTVNPHITCRATKLCHSKVIK